MKQKEMKQLKQTIKRQKNLYSLDVIEILVH